MYTQKEKDGMAMSNKTIDKFAKQDCPDGYTWNGTECVEKKPLISLGAKLGVGAGIAGAIGLATSMIDDSRKDARAKKLEARQRDKEAKEKAEKEAKEKAEKEKNKKE